MSESDAAGPAAGRPPGAGPAKPAGRRILVVIPCLDEAATIGAVVRDFKAALPGADVLVVDNGSSDGTAAEARAAGAAVLSEPRRGKGRAVAAAFEAADADAVVLVDGDCTYHAPDAARLVEPVLSGQADMAVGTRLASAGPGAFPGFNHAGNLVMRGVLNVCFGTSFQDILSGYRAFSRRFLERVPVLTTGFEIETELTVQALERGCAIVEVPVSYSPRPGGSESKLRPFKDGYRILLAIAMLLRDHRPLRFFSAAALALAACSVLARAAGMRAAAFVLLGWASLAFVTGLLLNTVNTRFREAERLMRRRPGG